MKNKALFLDRDGVINCDKGYVFRIDDFHFDEDIFRVVSKANNEQYKVIVVTNQSGIGRGLYSEKDFKILMNWVIERFVNEKCYIDGVYYCPYHPIHGIGKYRKDSYLRKPAPGMLLKAAEDFSLDLTRSIMIGDSERDMEAAQAAGIPTRLHLRVKESKFGHPIQNLNEACCFIVAE